jgi:hypothetical protein
MSEIYKYEGDIQMSKIVGSIVNKYGCQCNSDITSQSIFKDFAWETLNPVEPIRVSEEPNNPTQVANVMLFGLEPGDEIWINGLFRIDNNSNSPVEIDTRIRKNGDVIYQFIVNVDGSEDDDLALIPVQTVDVITQAGPVNYSLVISTDDDDVNLLGPITFTATVIRR